MQKRNAALAIIIAACLSLGAKPADSREPSFTPFFASRMWEAVFGPPTPRPVTPEFVAQMHELSAVLVTSAPTTDQPPDTDPYLNPSLSSQERSAWPLMPFVMLQLCSLPSDGQWSELETQLATAVLNVIARLEPQLSDYAVTAAPENNAFVRTQSCNQFIERASDPQYLGHMIFTLDDGPWALLELNGECIPKEEKIITDEFTLRLCEQPSGSWGIEGLSNGERIWQQSLSQVPNRSLTFLDMDPVDLDEYGWRVNMSFGELVHLYVNPDFTPMFYFTSW